MSFILRSMNVCLCVCWFIIMGMGLFVNSEPLELDPKLVQASNLQRALARNLPLPQAIAAYHGTHNSFSSTSTSPFRNTGLVFEHPRNQILSFVDQLHLGARFVELDVHYLESQQRMVCCHVSEAAAADISAQCTFQLTWPVCNALGIFDFGEHTGCPADAPDLLIYLEELHTFMNDIENHNEFMVVHIDSDTFESRPDVLNEHIESVFGEAVFGPNDWNGRWPTITQVRESNKYIMFISSTEAEHMPRVFGSDLAESVTVHAITDDEGRITCPDTITPFMRVRGDVTVVTFDGEVVVNGPQLHGVIQPQHVRTYQECGLHTAFDAFDQHLMASTLWSWDQNQPKTHENRQVGLCAMSKSPTYRWSAEPCHSKGVAVCRRVCDDKNASKQILWKLGLKLLTHATAQHACPSGYALGTPRTPIENAALIRVMKQSKYERFWLAYTSGHGPERNCWTNLVDGTTECI